MIPVCSARYTSVPVAARRTQRGALLLEALLGGIIIAAGLGTVMMLKFEESRDQKDTTVAQQSGLILDAAKAYIEDSFAIVEANAQADSDHIIEIAISTIQAADYLPPSFQNVNGYGQTYTVYVRWLAENQLEVIVPTQGGQAIAEARVPRVAAKIGANGGYVTSASQARGAQGGWEMTITPYQIAGAALTTGHILATQYYADGQLIADYLYRNVVPGMPEANRMYTAIDMNGNDLNAVNAVSAVTMVASTEVSGNIVNAATELRIGSQSLDENRAAMINALYEAECTVGQVLTRRDGNFTCEVASGVPSGAIAAFAGACPIGWSEYAAAQGRFLIGVGTANGQSYSVGQIGGEAFHTLTIAEMPSHRHDVVGRSVVDSAGSGGSSLYHAAQNPTMSTTWGNAVQATGGNQPHENRPPYVAVRWCAKG